MADYVTTFSQPAAATIPNYVGHLANYAAMLNEESKEEVRSAVPSEHHRVFDELCRIEKCNQDKRERAELNDRVKQNVMKFRANDLARDLYNVEKAGDVAQAVRENLLDAEDIDEIQVEYLVASMLAKDSLAWLYGDPGCYKSFVALDLAASVALGVGVGFAGAATQQGPALYVAAEGSAGMSKRKRAWEAMAGRSLSGQFTFLTMAIRITEEPFLRELIAVCRDLRPAIVVIDTQSRVTPGLEENGSVMSTYVDAVNALRMETGACVLTLHHTTKGTDVLRGHGSLYGAADTVLYLAKTTGAGSECRYAKLSVKKQKDDRDDFFWNIRLRVQHFCGGPGDGEHDPTRCSSLVPVSADWAEVLTAQAAAIDRVLLIVRQLEPMQSITTARITELADLPESTARAALKTCCDQGELERTGRGKSTAYIRPAAKIDDHSAGSASFRQPS
ncbi:AAA family ATPase [Streptomyces sp. AC602_WCS936]|uniref:AAA family ATPase n=1 Tax=Streptomyces sp. AC602_WCS936 TaxID=2823685 RepID=UPI001C27A993|nr:AAA family ATPase [Streptomyces sp. AC602_WCS936]